MVYIGKKNENSYQSTNNNRGDDVSRNKNEIVILRANENTALNFFDPIKMKKKKLF